MRGTFGKVLDDDIIVQTEKKTEQKHNKGFYEVRLSHHL